MLQGGLPKKGKALLVFHFPLPGLSPESQGEAQAAVGSWEIAQDQSVTSCFMLLTGTGSSVAPNSATEGSMVSSFTRTAMTSKRQKERGEK